MSLHRFYLSSGYTRRRPRQARPLETYVSTRTNRGGSGANAWANGTAPGRPGRALAGSAHATGAAGARAGRGGRRHARRFVAYFAIRIPPVRPRATPRPRVVGTPRGYARAGGRTRPESVRPSSAGRGALSSASGSARHVTQRNKNPLHRTSGGSTNHQLVG